MRLPAGVLGGLARYADNPTGIELCGYSVNALNRWWNLGQIQGVKYRNELRYSKESLACWLASTKGQAIAVPSQQHREWMKEFQAEEQDSGMESDSMPLIR